MNQGLFGFPKNNTRIIILRDEQTSGTNGGATATTTWNIRPINTIKLDTTNSVVVSNNRFSGLPPGNYIIDASSYVWVAPAGTNFNKMRLYNATLGQTIQVGMSSYILGNATASPTRLLAPFTVTNSDHKYEIHHYTAVAKATDGLGIPTSTGFVEVYLEALIVGVDGHN